MTTIPKAQATGRFKVVTDARVTTIEVDRNGRVIGVNYLKGGTEYFQPADVVLDVGATVHIHPRGRRRRSV